MKVLAEREDLRNVFLEALEMTPSPWHLVIGFDEFAPGDKMKVNNRRKCMVVNFSFIELGEFLRRDGAWFTPVAVRTEFIKTVAGGWSAMLREFLQLFLSGTHGIETVGVPIPGGKLLRATLGFLLSDGDGYRIAMDWKGASSAKPCLRHWSAGESRRTEPHPGATRRPPPPPLTPSSRNGGRAWVYLLPS